MAKKPKVEDEVLRVYLEENPSASPIEEDPEIWRRKRNRFTQQFLREYHLPTSLFRGASVLDLGCGSGEKAMIFASWDANVLGIDFNEQALSRARHLASISRYADNLSFLRGQLPELPPELAGRTFDVVHVDGVLHHLTDPMAGLHAVSAKVAPGAWLIVRNYQSTTAFQRVLKQALVRLGCGQDDERICENAIRLFSEDLERSLRFAGRPQKQALYDNFVAPLYRPFRHRDVVDFCQECGFEIYSLVPTPESPTLFGPRSVMASGETDERLGPQWAMASLARAMMATEPAATTMAENREQIQALSDAGHAFELSLDHFIDSRTGEAWDLMVTRLTAFVEAVRTTSAQLHVSNLARMDTFIAEIERIRPLVRECLEQDQVLDALPETSVLFRGMSGFPMAAWVLRKPELEADLDFMVSRSSGHG